MTTYVMEAVDNYNDVYGPQVSDNTAPANCIPDQLFSGMSFDAVRRKIMYVAYVCPNGTVTNDTGHALWNGTDSIAIGGVYDATSGKNLFVCELDIDTREVTWFDVWSSTSTVPASVFGDGTARRYTDTGTTSQGPKVVDPRTGNLWMHAFGASIACSIYLFRRADAFKQIISPIFDAGNHMTIRGLEDDWVYLTAEQFGVGNLQLTPREITAAETTADYLLVYASYALPAAFASSYNAAITDADGNMWWFSCKQSGTRGYALTKFTKPSPFVYPTPPSDGGFTDVTPWTGSTGPNTDVSAYTEQTTKPGPNEECFAFNLPATGDVALLSMLLPDNTGAGVTDPLLWRLDCTYVNLAGDTFDYHQGFVTGYMTADWISTTDANAAAWSVQYFLQTNMYLDINSYAFGGDYTYRRFYFMCFPVVGGVINTDRHSSQYVLVTYRFVSGAAPAVVSVYNETGWDAAYPAYGTAIGETNPLWWSIARAQDTYEIWSDVGLYDAVSNSWWTSSYQATSVYYLNPAFASRDDFSGNAAPPFLRLTLDDLPPPPVPSGDQFCTVFSRIGAPQGRQRFRGATPPSTPVNTVAPVISGTAVEGNSLAVSTGSWTGFPAAFDYQWARDGSPITDETASTYLLTADDVGKAILCTVTAHNSAGDTDADSNAVTPIAPGVPTNVTPPAITGNLTVGSTLTGSHGTWDQTIDSYAVQWKRAGSAITGAVGFTYITTGDDEGEDITFYVEATNSHGTGNATSSAVVPTAEPSGIPIADSAALTAMFAAGVGASGGKTYVLAGIDFGAVHLSGYDFSSDPIVIQGQSGTMMNTLFLTNFSGVTWEGFNVYGSYQGNAGIMVQSGTSHVTFNNVTSKAVVSEGTTIGSGYFLRSASFITINGANDSSVIDVYGRGAGVVALDCASVTIAGVTIENNGPDGILIAGCSTTVIDGALGYNWHYEAGAHPDFIQGFSSSSTGAPNSGVTITNSGWLREDGEAAQGYFFESTSNLVVSGCYLFGGLFNSIAQSGGATTTITDCFVQGFADFGSDIIGRNGTVNMSVSGCYTGALTNYAPGGPNPGFSPATGFGSNTQISNSTPGDYTDLDAWLLTHPNARARPA